jgi:hypothetical protein
MGLDFASVESTFTAKQCPYQPVLCPTLSENGAPPEDDVALCARSISVYVANCDSRTYPSMIWKEVVLRTPINQGPEPNLKA